MLFKHFLYNVLAWHHVTLAVAPPKKSQSIVQSHSKLMYFHQKLFFLWIQQVFYAFVLQGLLGAASHEDMLTHTLSAWEGWQHHRNVIWFFRAKLTITWKVHYILLCRRYWYKEYVVEFTALIVSTKNVFICDELHKSVLIMYAKNLSVNIIHCCT